MQKICLKLLNVNKRLELSNHKKIICKSSLVLGNGIIEDLENIIFIDPESFDASKRIGKKSFEGMKSEESEVWVTDCPLAALQFKQHAGIKPKHPMSIMAEAYRKQLDNKTGYSS